MKFLSSSSSSASSTSTTSDTNSYNPKNSSSGCLIGMLRRLLCFNALPTHPFDQIRKVRNEAKRCGELDYGMREEAKSEALGNPGIVARLMGLESMPGFDLDGTQARPNSITRSRSMNYVDSRREELMQGKHRRIKSTLSFREVPSFVELETEEFFILSFEGGGKDNELLLKSRKSDKGFRESKQKRTDKCRNRSKTREHEYEKNKENEVPNVASNDGNGGEVQDSSKKFRPTSKSNQNSHVAGEVVKQPKPTYHKQRGERRRSRRKKRKENCSLVQKVETESDSENSSPVSVLDYGEFPLKPEVQSSEEDLRLKNSNFRRKLSRELESCELSSPPITNNLNNNDGKTDKSEAKRFQSWKHDHKFQNYAEMLEEISRLSNTETMQSDKMYRETRQLEEFKDIGAAVGLEILDQLISEFLEL